MEVMGFERERLEGSRIQAKFGTLGGVTYWVNGKPRCLGVLKQEGKSHQYCFNIAGLKTDHEGSGRCGFHGGAGGRSPVHGRYATVAKNRLKEHYQEYLNDPQLLDLTPELALQRTLLQNIWERFNNEGGDNPDNLRMIRALLTDVTLTVDKIEKIQSQQVLTASAAKLMMAKAVEVQKRLLIEWFRDPQVVEERMGQFLLEWRSQVEP